MGEALRNYYIDFVEERQVCEEEGTDVDNTEDASSCRMVFTSCTNFGLEVSTKIPPWELTSISNIRKQAFESRNTLVGFCQDFNAHYKLDIYYIHAPKCWRNWHSRCNEDHKKHFISLRESWLAMEAVVGIDNNAKRIGLSNVSPDELKDIISFVKERQSGVPDSSLPPPRMPDALQAFADPLNPAEELRQICKDNGIEFVSYSTLGTQHVMANGGVNPVLNNGDIISIANKHSRSAAEVVLSWAMQRDMSVIPRSSNHQHIRELSNMLSPQHASFLTEEDLLLIDQLGYN